MNCKPGDLAIVVGGKANLGKVLTCLRLATTAELDSYNFRNDSPVWMVDRALETLHGKRLPLAPDHMLKPLRDPGDDAKDESTLWLPPVPHKEHA